MNLRYSQPSIPAELLSESMQYWESLPDALKNRPQLEPALLHVFACSPFVARTIVADVDLFDALLDLEKLSLPFHENRFDDFTDRLLKSDNDELYMHLLRKLRQREIVRIAIRDLLGLASLSETLSALSSLARYCIRSAHAKSQVVMQAKHGLPVMANGDPQSLMVLAMGKLGGNELNYSSDVDLILVYPEQGQTRVETGQSSIENAIFFTKQAQLLVQYVHATTEDGFVFRVDTRLRPYGDSGALVVSQYFLESYYQEQGRDWERYAMIKAQAITGYTDQIESLMSSLKPFVYRRYLDYGAFAALRQMKQLIVQEVARKGLQDNVKLGSGGIREIEFITQTYQLIRGGREPALRNRELMQVLPLLAEHQHLDQPIVDTLLKAYVFLRDTENRLQMIADQQTHSLPNAAIEKIRIAYAMGYKGWKEFSTILKQHRNIVANHFAGIFLPDNDSDTSTEVQSQLLAIAEGSIEVTDANALLEPFSFTNTANVIDILQKFGSNHSVRNMSTVARDRLSLLLSNLLECIASTEQVEKTLERTLHVVAAIVQRSVYIALLNENRLALEKFVKLCEASDWITEYLYQQPILLDTLLDPRLLLDLPSKNQLAKQLHNVAQVNLHEDFDDQLNNLRRFKQEHTLRVAAVDVSHDLPLMKVSDQLTWLAEVILEHVVQWATDQLLEKYGRPGSDGVNQYPELVVIAYGKLGGIELSYASDLDVVFVHDHTKQDGYTDGPTSIPNTVFFIRLAQKIVHILGTQTLGGRLYDVDVRLRPDGEAGVLVSSFEAYTQYQHERAWTWEHQALVRARVLVGSKKSKSDFLSLRREILQIKRDATALRRDVAEMRDKMRTNLSKGNPGRFDLKQDRGGIADIEFIVQYAVLRWSAEYPELTEYTDNVRLLEQLGYYNLINKQDIQALIVAYKYLRLRVHRLSLQSNPAILDNFSDAQQHIRAVADIWLRLMEDPVNAGELS